MDIKFALQSYKTKVANGSRVINAHAERLPPDSKYPMRIAGTHGIKTFAECGSGPVRGGRTMNGRTYVVSGQELYEIYADGTNDQIGAGITGTGPVRMDDNGDEMAIVNGEFGWIYTETRGLDQIIDPEFFPARTVTNIDNIFAYDKKGTNFFFISGLLAGTDYSALDVAGAESSSDFVQAVLNHSQMLLVFGARTIEPWFNAGAQPFPFQRFGTATVPRGVIAPYSICAEDSSPFFLGDDRVHYRLNGLQPERISTHALEEEWEGYDRVDDAFSYAYTFNGHKFIVTTFPTAKTTFVYDVSTKLYHERESLDAGGFRQEWRGACAFDAFHKTMIGDSRSGKIGYCDNSTFTQFDDPVLMTLISPPLHGSGKRVFTPAFELDMETGVGLPSGQGEDPQVILSISDDGCRTWQQVDDSVSFGKIGEYGIETQARWDRLGSAYQRNFRVQISDPVKRSVLAARVPGLYLGT